MEILVIDDERPIRFVLALVLGRAGHCVRAVTNGREGLDAVAQQRFDLILCDFQMPVMDGAEFAQALHLQANAPPLVFIGTIANEATARTLGAAGYLPKPFGAEELLDYIAKVQPMAK